jgi:hypothetical protein
MRFFLRIVRGIIMKGASLDALYPDVIALLVFGATVFGLSWVRFSKRVK